jgi:hypothetical protein
MSLPGCLVANEGPQVRAMYHNPLTTDHWPLPRPLPMTPNPFLGVIFHWLGGLASGSFYVPYRFVRQWSWETY